MSNRPFYYQETSGIRITVRPVYLPGESQPTAQRFIFAYFIRIENIGTARCQLLTRHWHIIDSIGEESEVVGEGVVGQQPILGRGEVHEYNSFCILKSPRGAMYGTYRFIRADDTLFEATIPRFELIAEV
jgi:ApaG protein